MADERAPILMQRRFGALVPCSDIDTERLREIGNNKTVEVAWKDPQRSHARLRLYWALIRIVRENMDNPPPAEVLHDAIKVRLGYTKTITFKNGEEVILPGSIAFGKMTEAQFAEFFDRFKDFLSTTVIPGLNSEAAEIEAKTLLGEIAPPRDGGVFNKPPPGARITERRRA